MFISSAKIWRSDERSLNGVFPLQKSGISSPLKSIKPAVFRLAGRSLTLSVSHSFAASLVLRAFHSWSRSPAILGFATPTAVQWSSRSSWGFSFSVLDTVKFPYSELFFLSSFKESLYPQFVRPRLFLSFYYHIDAMAVLFLRVCLHSFGGSYESLLRQIAWCQASRLNQNNVHTVKPLAS